MYDCFLNMEKYVNKIYKKNKETYKKYTNDFFINKKIAFHRG